MNIFSHEDAQNAVAKATAVVVSGEYSAIEEDAFAFSEVESVVIEEGVTAIGNSAFSCCEKLASVTLPTSLRTIGDTAFAGCISLTRITIPNGVEQIGEQAFYNCIELEEAVLPESVTKIGKWAFENCSKVTVKSTRKAYARKYCNGVWGLMYKTNWAEL